VHQPVPAGQSVPMDPDPPSGDPGPGAPEPRTSGPETGPESPAPLAPGPRRLAWRSPAFLAVAVAVAGVTIAAVATAGGGSGHHPAGTRTVSVTEAPVGTVDLQAVPGQLTIVGAATNQIRLTGVLDWRRHAPAATARRVNAHLLRLSYRCAANSPCTAHWRLVVPRHTAIVISQPSGHLVLAGLAGPLRITAASVDVSATRLSSPSLQATITSGHLAATFDVPPRQVSVTLTSAQATLLLPNRAAYTVSDQVTSGYVDVGIPVASGAAHTVTANVVSGELNLQPS
jgi:Toastrack DUF4097